MTFKTDIETDMAVFFNTAEMGEAAVYDDGSGPVDVTVVLAGAGSGPVKGTHAIIEAQVSQVPAPADGQTFVVDGVTWTVVEDPAKGPGIVSDGVAVRIPVVSDMRYDAWHR